MQNGQKNCLVVLKSQNSWSKAKNSIEMLFKLEFFFVEPSIVVISIQTMRLKLIPSKKFNKVKSKKNV
jgi:hypothetical protein